MADLGPTADQAALLQLQRSEFAAAAFDIAELWGGRTEDLSPRQRTHGAVHAMLDMLENGTERMPRCDIVPKMADDDVMFDSQNMGPGWDYDAPLELRAPQGEHSVTDVYKGMYDTYRHRFSIAAKDLFDSSHISII